MEAPQRKVASSASRKEYKPGIRVFRIGCASFLQKAKKDDKREEETGQPPREHVHQPFLDSVSNICIKRRRPRLTFHWNCRPVNLQDCQTHITHTNIMYIVHTQQYSTHNHILYIYIRTSVSLFILGFCEKICKHSFWEVYIYVHRYVYICVYTYLCKMDKYRHNAGLS